MMTCTVKLVTMELLCSYHVQEYPTKMQDLPGLKIDCITFQMLKNLTSASAIKYTYTHILQLNLQDVVWDGCIRGNGFGSCKHCRDKKYLVDQED